MIDLELKYGRKDLLTTLDEARERVIAGKVEAIVLIDFRDSDDTHGESVSWKDDMLHPWARVVAALGSMLARLHAEGLEDQMK